MTILQRASFKLGPKSPWLRFPRSRHHHGQRNSSTSSSPKDSPKKQPPHSSNEASSEASNGEPIDIPIQLWYHRLGAVSTFFNWFHRTQERRPYTVQVCTTLTTYLCGDLLAQDIGGEPYDPRRTLRMLTIGALDSIPGYKWYVKKVDAQRMDFIANESSGCPLLTGRTGSCFWAAILTTPPRSHPWLPRSW